MRRTGIALAMLSLAFAGCRAEPDVRYGLLEDTSINGFRVFNEMFRQTFSGLNVAGLSTRLDECDLVIHPMVDRAMPTAEEAEWIDSWLHERPGRQFVLVLRDGSVTSILTKQWADELRATLTEAEDDDERRAIEESIRKLERLAEVDEASTGSLGSRAGQNALGFRLMRTPELVTRRLEFAPGFEAIARLPKTFRLPHALRGDAIEVLMAVDDNPYILESWFGESRLIVVANATPFVDAALVDPDARALLDSLFAYVSEWEPNMARWVEPAAVGDEDAPMPSMLGMLLTKPPVNGIFLHFLALGAAFVYFRWRWLGRVQAAARPDLQRFGRHVEALAHLLRYSKSWRTAYSALAEWRGAPRTPPKTIDDALAGVAELPRRTTRSRTMGERR